MRRHLNRWLDALGEHIARHGWVDPTGAAAPPPQLDHDATDLRRQLDEPPFEPIG